MAIELIEVPYEWSGLFEETDKEQHNILQKERLALLDSILNDGYRVIEHIKPYKTANLVSWILFVLHKRDISEIITGDDGVRIGKVASE